MNRPNSTIKRLSHFPLAFGGYGLDDPVLCCLECGCPYVHIASVRVDQGHVRAIAECDEVHIAASDRHDGQRGSIVKLSFFCEYGHWFEYEFEFMKGHTFVRSAIAKRSDPEQTTELWRN